MLHCVRDRARPARPRECGGVGWGWGAKPGVAERRVLQRSGGGGEGGGETARDGQRGNKRRSTEEKISVRYT